MSFAIVSNCITRNVIASDEASNICTSACVVFYCYYGLAQSLLPVGALIKRAGEDVELSPATLMEREMSGRTYVGPIQITWSALRKQVRYTLFHNITLTRRTD